jgi:hypothetical protein
MKCARIVVSVALLVSSTADIQVAQAQVPPHYPGSICFTQNFWCWINPPGPVGGQCWCASPYGAVPGRLG